MVGAPERRAQSGAPPPSHDETKLLDAWRATVTELRGLIPPDRGGDNTGPNYGASFAEAD